MFTESKEIIKTNKFLNGETVSYSLMTVLSVFMLMAIKQVLKTFFSVDESVSCAIGFAAASIISYLLERRFVFRKSVLSSNLKQIILFAVRTAVNFGFYELTVFLFYRTLDMNKSFAWLSAIVLSFFFNYFFDRNLLFDCNYNAVEIKQSKIYRAFFYNRYVFASAGLAAISITVIYLIYSVFPFGDYTVMRMDLYHQYGPLFAELYDRVVNHQSFIYSWTTGGGSSFLGNYLNYLASPLSALIFLFDKENISYAISFIVSIKCILSAASFSYYLKKSLNGNNIYSSLFGVLYAFCAYFLAYYWNVMWLDAMFILPLVALGIENIINKGNSKLYLFSLAYILFSNYYMGFMMCIFAVLYFLLYYFITSTNSNSKIDANLIFDKKYSAKAMMNNRFFNRGLNFAVTSVLSACLCAFTLIPVFVILRNSSATSDTFPEAFKTYFSVFDFITAHFAGIDETIRSSGDDVLPNIYCGVLSVILLPLFVINRKIKFKEKAGYIFLLLFFLLSFNTNYMNFIWHGFHFPNDLPYRFSFMYSFILLIIGYKTLKKFKAISTKDIAYVGLAWLFFAIITQELINTKMTEATIYTMIGFIILWTGYLMLVRKGTINSSLSAFMAVIFVFCEIFVSDTFRIKITQSNSNYKENYKTYTEAIDYIDEKDDGFYRTELCYLNTRMDPSYYGYNGMSVFSSMAYESYSGLQKNLGMFGNTINSYTYNPQTPIYNMMFNLKYLIQTDESLPLSKNLYSKIYTTSDEKSNVYKNKYFLPIAYCVNTEVEDWITDNNNPFEAQNDFFQLATGYSDPLKSCEYLETEFDDLTGDEVVENGTYWVNKIDSESTYGFCNVTITPITNGNTYIYVKSSDIKTIEVNSKRVASHTQSVDEDYILDVGYHEAGEEITISIDGGSIEDSDEGYFDIYCYSVDEAVLDYGYNTLKRSALQVTSHSDTQIEGTINVKENCYLYSSIPYDDGWKIYIDGEDAESFAIGDTLLATAIKPGEHKIVYKYSPNGLSYGVIITAVTVFGLCGYTVYNKKIAKTKKRKNEEIVD